MRKHHSPGAQRTGRGGDAGRAGCCAPDLAGGTHVLRRHSPGAQRTGRKRDLQGERLAAPSKSQGPELRCALRYSRRRGQRCAAPSDNAGAALVRKRRPPGAQRTGRGGDAGRASCCAPGIAGAALMRKHHSLGAQRTGRGGDAGQAGCCAPDLAGGAYVLKSHSPGAQRTERRRVCRASDLLRPLDRKGQSCAAPSDIAGVGGQRCAAPSDICRRCACAQAPPARCSAHWAGRRCRASELLRPRSCRRYACAQAPLAGCSAHRAKKGLQGERLAAPSKSQGPELRCALIIMQALRLCAGAARQVLSALGGEGMQGERVAAPQV